MEQKPYSTNWEIEGNDNGQKVIKIEENLIYLEGHPYPHKGIPTQEKVEQANEIKHGIKRLKIINAPEAYLGAFASEIKNLSTKLVGDNAAHSIAFVLEYDNAYRFRLQDLFTATTKERLNNPLEILRLSKLNKEREKNKTVHSKLVPLFWLTFIYATLHRKKWKQAIEQSDFTNLQFDKGDIYWAKLKQDYTYGTSSR